MTQASPDPNEEPRRHRQLTSDELIALFVAFTTLGSVFFWGMTRSGFNLAGLSGEWSREGLFGERMGNQDRDAGRLFGLGSPSAEDRNGDLEADGVESERRFPAQAPREDLDRVEQSERYGRVGSRPREINSFPVAPTVAGAVAAGEVADGADAAVSTEENGATAADETQAAPLNATRDAIAFQDVPEDYWAKPYIDALSSRQLIEGFDDNTFKPNEPVNRAQLAALITQAFVLNQEKDAIAFTDLAEAEWATPAIEDAVKSGFMAGFPDQSFKPNMPVPRAQVLTALVTGLNTEAAGNVQNAVDRYTDAAQIPEWAVGKMAAATQSGIVVNYPDVNQLAPNQPATRAEVAAMIYQALAYQGRLDPIDSPYVVNP